MKRVILTGGTGFVGVNLARKLISEGHEVHLFLRPGFARWRIASIAGDIQCHIIDLGDVEALKAKMSQIRPDWIFHLAAFGAYPSQTSLRKMAETNLMATANLVDACLGSGVEAFINTGSSSEYGYKDHPPAEDEWLEPNSAYAVTKAAGTHYCRYIARSKNMPVATLRLYSAFGAYEEPTRLIPTLILEGLQNRLPPLVNPHVARDYIYIEDVLDAYLQAALHPSIVAGKIYNIGSGVQTSLSQVVDLARQVLPVSEEPHWGTMPDRQWDTSVWVADHTSITRDLGWTPAHSFAEGFKQTVRWFQSNPDMLSYYKNNREAPQ